MHAGRVTLVRDQLDLQIGLQFSNLLLQRTSLVFMLLQLFDSQIPLTQHNLIGLTLVAAAA